MKTIFYSLSMLILGIFVVGSANAQNVNEDFLNKMQVKEIPQYELSQKFADQIILKIPYSESSIQNANDAKLIQKVKVKKVELVYSKYPNTDSFVSGKQIKINLDRLKALEKALPDLFVTPDVEWVIVPQTNCNSSSEAREMFHGFVISYEFYKQEGEKKN